VPRAEKSKFLAIAEWPTSTGPADYILFAGLVPLATVEAKWKNIDVSGSLQQAKHNSRSFRASDGVELPSGPWAEFQIPFVLVQWPPLLAATVHACMCSMVGTRPGVEWQHQTNQRFASSRYARNYCRVCRPVRHECTIAKLTEILPKIRKKKP
jgi:hypothetical protein